MIMEKNPFSLLDFLGYVFPGALALFLIHFFGNLSEIQGLQFLYDEISKSVNTDTSLLEKTIYLTVASYILGHFIAYLSSLTVEQFSIWLYGYPSDFLLKDVPSWHYWTLPKRGDKLSKRWRYLCRIIIGLFLLPLSICSLVFAKLLGGKYFFIKKLDKDLIHAITDRCADLAQHLNFKISEEEAEKTDCHRVIYQYEYERQKLHASTMGNYIALYDLLRSVTFIFNCLFLYILFFAAIPTIDFSCHCINWKLIRLLFATMSISYVFFMAFIKFYRRFTLESFMCLLVDTSFPKSDRSKQNNNE